MDYKIILDNLDNLCILITDKHNNIVYPNDLNKQNYIKNISDNFKEKENCYCYNNKYFKKNIKKIKSNSEDFTLIYFDDITNYKILEKKKEIDNLTTILNRNTVLDKIDVFLQTNKNNFSIVMADIDDFKNINDTYGHIIGDIILNKIGTILNNSLKDCLVGRYGGEEFIILEKNPNIKDNLNQIEQIKESISNINISYENFKINNISMSFGIYNVNEIYDNNLSIEEFRNKLINCADIALYKSKNNGKNQITTY